MNAPHAFTLIPSAIQILLCFTIQQEIQRIHDLNPVDVGIQRLIHRNDDFLVVVLYRHQRRQFPFPCFRITHGFGHLDISFGAVAGCDKIDLLIVQFPNRHIVSTPEQFQIYDILQQMAGVTAPVTQQVIAKASVRR